MYWLFTDETNVTDKEGDFFIYGGLIVSADQMVALNKRVIDIRNKYGYVAGDSFKFQTKSRPAQVSIADFAAAKGEALTALAETGAKVVIYTILHAIAKNQSVDNMTRFGLNALISHFNREFLGEQNDMGAVCIDRLDPAVGYSYMTDTFANGLTFQASGYHDDLARIVHYSMSCDGASHMSSVADIALGSMRYATNFAGGKGKEEVARKLMLPLARAMWQKTNPDGSIRIGGYGFLQYPKNIQVAAYQAKYDELVEVLTRLASEEDEPAQGEGV